MPQLITLVVVVCIIYALIKFVGLLFISLFNAILSSFGLLFSIIMTENSLLPALWMQGIAALVIAMFTFVLYANREQRSFREVLGLLQILVATWCLIVPLSTAYVDGLFAHSFYSTPSYLLAATLFTIALAFVWTGLRMMHNAVFGTHILRLSGALFSFNIKVLILSLISIILWSFYHAVVSFNF